MSETNNQHLQGLLQDIRGKDVGKRMAAIERLQCGPRKHVDVVMELVNDKGRDVRVLACRLLAAIKPSYAVRVLLDKTRDKDPNVREAACAALGSFRNPRAVSGLTAALRDRAWVACAAACSLGQIGGNQAFKQLVKLFSQGDSLRATAACQALLRWDDPRVAQEMVEIVRKWRKKKRERFIKIILEEGQKETLGRLKAVFGDELLGHLRSIFQGEHKAPMRLLLFTAEFGNQEACDLILDKLAKQDPDEDDYSDSLTLFASLHAVWKNRVEAYLSSSGQDQGLVHLVVKACALTGTKIRESTLLKVLSLSPLEVKREIARSLTLIAGPSAELVENLLFDTDDHIRGDAAAAAAYFNICQLAPRVEELARMGFLDTRQKALRSLGMLDRNRARDLVEEFVDHGSIDDKKVYLAAVEVIDKETNYHLIRRLLHSRETRIAALAATAMGRLIEQDPRYLDYIEQLLRRRKILPEVLEIIKVRRLKTFQSGLLGLLTEVHDHPWTRYQVLSALAAMEDEALYDVFAAELNDDHNLMRIAGIKGLARLGQKRASELIWPFVRSSDPDVCHAAKTALDALSGDDGSELN